MEGEKVGDVLKVKPAPPLYSIGYDEFNKAGSNGKKKGKPGSQEEFRKSLVVAEEKIGTILKQGIRATKPEIVLKKERIQINADNVYTALEKLKEIQNIRTNQMNGYSIQARVLYYKATRGTEEKIQEYMLFLQYIKEKIQKGEGITQKEEETFEMCSDFIQSFKGKERE